MTKRLSIPLLIATLSLSIFAGEDDGKILFILSGQSNMQGMNEKLTFVPRVEEEYGKDNVLVVKEAIGGRPIRMWVHDWAPAPGWEVDPDIPNTKPPTKEENGILYDSMMQKIADATKGKKPKAIAFCWMQGERDARERHSAVYEKSLRTLFQQLENDFPDIPMVFAIGRLSDFGKGNKEAFYPEWDEVRRAQENIAESMPNCTLINTDDLNTGDSPPHWKTKQVSQRVDDLHMSAEGYRIMGERFANESIKLLNKVMEVQNDGTAPEVTDLNAEDVSYAKEKDLPNLKNAFISMAPNDRRDGIPVGTLGSDAEAAIRTFAKEIFDGQHGDIDSLLVAKGGKLVFESYYRRGRANYPHYQMSITKSYTAMAIGRAIQLGHLTMDDLDKPVVDFLKELDRGKLAEGAENITLAEAMNMRSGIRIDKEKAQELMKQPDRLRGQGQIQAYLEHSSSIPDSPRDFKYQASDPSMTMQVLESVVPGSAKDFIKTELLGQMGITNYHWDPDVSGLPKSAAGSSMRSRDMLKWGLLVMDGGTWNGEQLIPAEFVKRATDRIHTNPQGNSYGYFWWRKDVQAGNKTYDQMTGRGAGGQFIQMYPELDLVVVITAHNKGMGKMLTTAPERIIPAFSK
jgi:CubicO group peptidase (beta-lactamase class C family)